MNFRELTEQSEIERVMFLFEEDIHNKMISREQLSILAKKFSENAIFLLMEVDNESVGFCSFYANDHLSKRAFISMIIIGGKYQRRGYGRNIMLEVENKAKERGMCTIRAEVALTNEKSKCFFESQGFEKSVILKKSIFFEKTLM